MLPAGDEAGRLARILALGVPAGLLGGAYVSQYVFGLYPCEMCWWQRYPHFAALLMAAIALSKPPGRPLVVLAGLSILISGAIGFFHAGVEYRWWEGITACATTAQAGGNALDAILDAPIVRCDVAPWELFGISLAGFNFLISTAGAAGIFALLRRNGKAL
jgi:disulfide bond formation protein DsbB